MILPILKTEGQNNDVHSLPDPLRAQWGYLPLEADRHEPARPVGCAKRQGAGSLKQRFVEALASLSVGLIIIIALCAAVVASAPRPADFFGPDEMHHAALGRLRP